MPNKVNKKQTMPNIGVEVLLSRKAYLKGKTKTSKIIPKAINLFLIIKKC